MAEEIILDFNKKLINPSTIKFLESKIKVDCEKEWINTLFKGAIQHTH